MKNKFTVSIDEVKNEFKIIWHDGSESFYSSHADLNKAIREDIDRDLICSKCQSHLVSKDYKLNLTTLKIIALSILLGIVLGATL